MSERNGAAEPTQARLTAEEEEVRGLLAHAGLRSEVPGWDLAIVKQAARREWTEMVAAERERKRVVRGSGGLALAASLVLAVLLGWWWSARTPVAGKELVASVELSRGAVSVEGWAGRGSLAELPIGSRVPAGASIATGEEPEGRLAIRLAGGHSVRLDATTRLRFVSDRRLELERGAVYLDSGLGDPGSLPPIEIVTAFGVVRDIGTQFEVRLGDGQSAVRVRVREGKVSLDSDGATHLAAAGEELNLGRDGSVLRAEVAAYGPAWGWVQRSAPSLEIEGLTLQAFLGWVSRETGWPVVYDDAALERSAASILLHGTIGEATPEESLSVIMPSSGLGYAIEQGKLRVTPPTSATGS